MTTLQPTTTAALVLEAVAPDRLMNLNDREHYMVHARRVRSWRWWASIVGRHNPSRVARQLPPSIVAVELPVRDKRPRDPHNYVPTLKAIIDGLVDAGLWPDDNSEWVTVTEPRLIVRRDHLVRILIDPRPDTPKENQ